MRTASPIAIAGLVVCTACVGEVGEDHGAAAPPNVPATDLPCEVEAVVAGRCWACHGQLPAPGLPALTSVAAFIGPARTDASQATGAVALARMQSTASPMPPPPSMAATADEIAVMSAWIAAGYPAGGGCVPICTSGRTWTEGNDGSEKMNPGMACIQCHAAEDEGPRFSIAGTVYPTIHEPDRCNGADGSSGARVIITGADGMTLTLAPNEAGNFFSEMPVAVPYRAQVITSGGARMMTAEQTSGDCNSCHTQAGANGAPGRIRLP